MPVIRVAILYEPLRVFWPLAVALGVGSVGKPAYDIFTTDFRIATDTYVVPAVAFRFSLLGLLFGLLMRLNKKRWSVVPAIADQQ